MALLSSSTPSMFARLFKFAAAIEAYELKAVVLSFIYFFLLLGSYMVLRPVRDAMGTVFDSGGLAYLYTGTFVITFACVPIYGALLSKVRLSTVLPWVYGFFAINLVIFYGLFETVDNVQQDRTVAAVFFVWVSVCNMFIISVFWSFLSDIFSRRQAKRLFGFIAAGGSVGAALGPLLVATFVNGIGTNVFLLISAAGFVGVSLIVVALEKEKVKLLASGEDVQRTTLDHSLAGNPFAGFTLLLKSPYLVMIAAFILMLTWVSTILYFQQAALVQDAFASREERTQVFAFVDTIVNLCAFLIQMFGTGRLVSRFGVTTALMLVPVVMVSGFFALTMAPVVMVLLVTQVVRRVAEYAVARPGREMLFTIVDQESRYKAKNVIDTVVYRFGDVSQAWVQAGLGTMGLAVVGTSVFGMGIAAVWIGIAYALGRRYERAQVEQPVMRMAANAN